MPSSNVAPLRPSLKNVISVVISFAVGGRRYARRASVVRICRAHVASGTDEDGRHTKIFGGSPNRADAAR